ncbi:hypothetical protein ACFPRL_18900 [Pseudoclavibacter helvolus]
MSKVAVPRTPATRVVGCVLLADGAQRPASRIAVMSSSEIACVASKPRGLQRSERASRIGTEVSLRTVSCSVM